MTRGTADPAIDVGALASDVASELINAEHDRAYAEGFAIGRLEFRTRLAAIVGDRRMAGREVMAATLAIAAPEMDAEDVIQFCLRLATEAPKQHHPTIAERIGHIGVDLALGGPMERPTKDGALPASDDVYAARNAARSIVPLMPRKH